MLPPKIYAFMKKLLDKTTDEEVEWDYDSANDSVSVELKKISVRVHYYFDYDQEVSVFRVDLTDGGKKYTFICDQNEDDYLLVRKIYESAQASEIDLDLEDI